MIYKENLYERSCGLIYCFEMCLEDNTYLVHFDSLSNIHG